MDMPSGYPASDFPPMHYPSNGLAPSQSTSGHLGAPPNATPQLSSPMNKPYPAYDGSAGPTSAGLVPGYPGGAPAPGSGPGQSWSSMRPQSPGGYGAVPMMGPPIMGPYTDAPGGYYAPDQGYGMPPQTAPHARGPAAPGYGMAPAPMPYDQPGGPDFQSTHPGGSRIIAPPKRSHHARPRPIDTGYPPQHGRHGAVAQAAGSAGGAPQSIEPPDGSIAPMRKDPGPSDFIRKLYKILHSPDESVEHMGPGRVPELPPGTVMGHLICWSGRDRFVVKNQHAFERRVLPHIFRHCNFASFVRQLNKYGFTKVPNKGGSRESPQEDSEGNPWQIFTHDFFVRDRPDLMDTIRRKQANTKRPRLEDGGYKRAHSPDSNDQHSSGEDRHGRGQPFAPQMESWYQEQIRIARSEAYEAQAQLKHVNDFVAEMDALSDQTLHSLMALDKTINPNTASPTALTCIQAYNDLMSKYGYTKRYDAGSLFDMATPFLTDGNFSTTSDSTPTGMQAGGSPGGLPNSANQATGQEGQGGNGPLGLVIDANMPVENPAANNLFDPIGNPSSRIVPSQAVPLDAAPLVDDVNAVNPVINQLRKARKDSIFAGGWTQKPRILVVEDDPICRKLARKYLLFMGCDVDSAEDGGEAVELAKQKQYEVCFMDIHLPTYSGDEAAAQIREFNVSMPIISMTSDKNIELYRSRGMTDHIAKPLTPQGMKNVLHKYTTHLLMRRVSELIPPLIGVPPVNDEGLHQAITLGSAEIQYDAAGNIVGAPANTMGGMGISDDVFTMVSHAYRQRGSFGNNSAELFSFGNFGNGQNALFFASPDFNNGTIDGLVGQDPFQDGMSWSTNTAQVTELN